MPRRTAAWRSRRRRSSSVPLRQSSRHQHQQQHEDASHHLSRRHQSSLALAAQKLCSTPGLIASTGTEGRGLVATMLSRHVRGVVFGGLDGILTTFALLAAVAGSKATSPSLMLVIGISTVFADALSMGAGEYLSAKAEEELEGSKGGDDEPSPLEKGFAMFLAFTLFGLLPLVGGIISSSMPFFGGASPFAMSVVITALTLFALGGIKSQFGAGVWWLAGVEVTGIGGAAAAVAYCTARVVERLMGES